MSGTNGTWAVIAGGGTGGHVEPALAVAGALVRSGHRADEIHFVGSARGMEARLVPEAGYGITLLPGRGIQRGRDLRARWLSARAVAGLVAATFASVWILARRRPAVVFSVGGYAALPCTLAAVVLRVPFVVAEPNSVPGAANRLVGRFARAAAVAFPGTGMHGEVVTGVPLRDEIESVGRDAESRRRARSGLGLPQGRWVLGVTGGSLGARRINEAIVDLAERWRKRDDLALHHVVGRRDFPEIGHAIPWGVEDRDGAPPGAAPGAPPTGSEVPDGLWYRAVEFERRMPALLAAADVMVCRAGASTVAELATVGVPAVLVPLPNSPGDHQGANARAMAAAGAAVVLPDADCTGERLEDLLDGLFEDGARLEEMGAAGRRLARPGGAARIAELLELHARPVRRPRHPEGGAPGVRGSR